MKRFFVLVAGALTLALSGCPSPGPSPGPVIKPDGFGNLDTLATALVQRAAAGVAVAKERAAANDLPGTVVALDLVSPLLPAPLPQHLDWFRKLTVPGVDVATIANAKAENARLLEEVKALQAKVAVGISPDEVARRLREQADADAARNSRTWRDRILYGLCGVTVAAGVGLVGAGLYFGIRRLQLTGGGLIPCGAFIGFIPGFLESAAFQRMQTLVTYSLGAVVLGLLGFGAYEIGKWLSSAKASRVAEVAGTLVKAAK